jgi:hypothetical protein
VHIMFVAMDVLIVYKDGHKYISDNIDQTLIFLPTRSLEKCRHMHYCRLVVYSPSFTRIEFLRQNYFSCTPMLTVSIAMQGRKNKETMG